MKNWGREGIKHSSSDDGMEFTQTCHPGAQLSMCVDQFTYFWFFPITVS